MILKNSISIVYEFFFILSRQIRKLYLVEQEKSRDFDKAMKSENKKKIFSLL